MRLYKNQPAGTVTRARQLRREASEPERRLLRALRESFPSCKWRHQTPVGPFYADVLCFAEKLVIEVDGDSHADREQRDAARTAIIEDEGFRVLRFWNNDVVENLDGVIATVADSLSHREREGAAQRRKGEGDLTIVAYAPSPRAAAPLAPLPAGEGK